jgi:hypothetical protein
VGEPSERQRLRLGVRGTLHDVFSQQLHSGFRASPVVGAHVARSKIAWMSQMANRQKKTIFAFQWPSGQVEAASAVE